MFLDKKNCDFIKRLNNNRSGSVYKLFRDLFSMGTINKKLTYLKDMKFIIVEKNGRINDITFTDKGKRVLELIYEIETTCY